MFIHVVILLLQKYTVSDIVSLDMIVDKHMSSNKNRLFAISRACPPRCEDKYWKYLRY
jgi:hypothetical protein